MRNLILSSLLACSLTGVVSAQPVSTDPSLDPTAQDAAVSFGAAEPVRLVLASGETHTISAEMAVTPQQQARGLMWRESVEPGTGMLFHYDPPESASMWMRNTLVDLDLVFVDADGRIVKIIAFAQAESLRSLPADAIVAGVLELGAGQTIEMGLRPGDTVRHAIFGNDADEADVPSDDTAAEDGAGEAQ